MLSRTKSIAAIVGVIVMLGSLTVSAQAAGVTGNHLPIGLHRVPGPTWLSPDWSGYVVGANLNGGSTAAVQSVKGYWTVPSVACVIAPSVGVAAPQYSSIWVGMDGLRNTAHEQVGTEQDCVNGTVRYSAWYNLGTQLLALNMVVRPGDVFYGSVQNLVKDDEVHITLVNETLALGFDRTIMLPPTIQPRGQTAEWILSTPPPTKGVNATLAAFGTVTFFKCQATISGHTGPIWDYKWQYASMEIAKGVMNAQLEDAVSGLSAQGTRFTLTYKEG